MFYVDQFLFQSFLIDVQVTWDRGSATDFNGDMVPIRISEAFYHIKEFYQDNVLSWDKKT